MVEKLLHKLNVIIHDFDFMNHIPYSFNGMDNRILFFLRK